MERVLVAKCVGCGKTRDIRAGEIPAGDTPMCDTCFMPMVAERAEFREVMGMIKTGVFVTEEELKDLTSLANQGWRAGDVMIVTSIMQGIMKDQKTVDARVACHRLALSHGLPEIEGYYGIKEDGEFVRAS